MKHSGKSKLGRMLADRFGCAFIDTDDRIELLYRERTGRSASVREVFGSLGEEGFSELEATAVDRLADSLLGNSPRCTIRANCGLRPDPAAIDPSCCGRYHRDASCCRYSVRTALVFVSQLFRWRCEYRNRNSASRSTGLCADRGPGGRNHRSLACSHTSVGRINSIAKCRSPPRRC